MAVLGRNKLGVPPASFAFYPKDFSPSKKNLLGETKESFRNDIAPDRTWCPGNIPYWDKSCLKKTSSSPECVSIERLFVIPWGSEDSSFGLRAEDIGKQTAEGYQDHRYAPSAFWVEGNGKLGFWDERLGKTKIFDYSGKLVGVVKSMELPIEAYPETRYKREIELQSALGNKFIENEPDEPRFCKYSYVNRAGVVFKMGGPTNQGGSAEVCDEGSRTYKCSVYFPEAEFEFGHDRTGRLVSIDGKGVIQYCRSSTCVGIGYLAAEVDSEGDIISPLVTEDGIAIHRYRFLRQ